jgi:hypothetical protein
VVVLRAGRVALDTPKLGSAATVMGELPELTIG